MSTSKKLCETVIAGMLILSSCGTDDAINGITTAPDNRESVTGVVCEVDLQEKGKIEFIASDGGDLLVLGEFPYGSQDAFDLRGSPVAVYEKYSGKSAPVALVAAYERSYRSSPTSTEGNETAEETVNRDDGAGLAKSEMNGTDFAESYYNNDKSIQQMCYKGLRTYCTGLFRIQRSCLTMGATVHPYSGNVTFRMKTKYGSTWDTLFEKSLTQGAVVKAYCGGVWRERIAEVTESEGDGFHVAFYGNEPLVQTRWSQGGHYNDMIPVMNDDKTDQAYLGCWSVAMAQMMNFHKAQPTGQVNYTCSKGTKISIDLSEYAFNWNLIRNVLNNSSTQSEIDETALYCYYAASALEKNYDESGYGGSTGIVDNELHDHYGFTTQSYNTNSYSLDELKEIIKTEIQARRPVWLYFALKNELENTSSGHAVVVDQYEGSGGNFKVHLNLGWAGTCDGLYSLESGEFKTDNLDFTYNEDQYKQIVTAKP